VLVCWQVTVGVYTVTDSSLSDQRTFDVVTRRDNVTSAQFDYTQPYELSVVDGVSLVQLATFTAASSLLTPAVCYYIVGESAMHRPSSSSSPPSSSSSSSS